MRPEVREIVRIALEHPGKVFGSIFGFIVGWVMILFSPIAGLYLAGCVAAGYLIGRHIDSRRSIRDVLGEFLPPQER
ncbi:MAG: DUF2273 domain-containing protein [Betaproteobacteria bacterium]